MLRSIGAVVGGFFFIGLLSFGTDAVIRTFVPAAYDMSGRMESVPWLLVTIGYVAVFAIIGCYLTARLAPSKPMSHALALGGLGLVFTIYGTVLAWATAPAWYHIVSILMVMPYAWLGGRLAEQRAARRSN